MFRKKINIKEQGDEKLVTRLMYNDTEAFNELYKRYSNRLLYYFYRMLGNDKELAQDCLQDIFYKVIDKSSLFDKNKKFSTWIFSVAHNMCKNEYRKREVRKIILKGKDLDQYIKEDHSDCKYPVTADIVFKEMECLEESYRTAFLLKYREGFSIDEIGEILNLPEGTVKSRLFYARKKLQEQIFKKMKNMIE